MIKGEFMRVLYITTVDINGKAGNSTHVREFIKLFSQYCSLLTILSPTSKPLFVADNLSYKKIISFNIPYLRTPLFFTYGFFAGFYYLLTNKCDLIYERNHTFGTGCLLGKIFSIPCVVEVNGWTPEEFEYKGDFLATVIKKTESNTFSLATRLITVTSNLKALIVNEYGIAENKITVVENGANTELFRPLDMKESRKKLNLDPNSNIMCFVGNLAHWQGVEYFVRAAPLILEKEPDTFFLVVGDGNMKDELEALTYDLGINDRFDYTGNVAYEQVPYYISASDVCVVPKKPLKSGYSPLKLYEYMACAKPIIASTVNGFEILKQIDAGILIDPVNSEEFSKAAIKLLSDSDLRTKMGLRGHDYVGKNHSWNAVAEKVMSTCQNALEVR
jgi:glycosyltransferase involved in cell wall biosynthesis